jgi:glycine dehydrogenase subunit 1
MASGGPYFGFFSTRMHHVRQMPGRLIGRTLDKDGKIGYSLTLQAREQHIRRAKATSNICTNQGLLVTAATIHMSMLGAEGLAQVAHQCHHNTSKLVTALTQITGVELAFKTPYFHEALLHLNKPTAPVLQALLKAGITGGYAVGSYYSQFPNALLVCATEMRTSEDIAHYAKALGDIMSSEG